MSIFVRALAGAIAVLALSGCQVDFSKGFKRYYGNIPGNSEPENDREDFGDEMRDKYGTNDDGGASVEERPTRP